MYHFLRYQTVLISTDNHFCTRETHNTQKIEAYLLNRQETFFRNATTFTPAILNKRYRVDISEIFTELDLLKENDRKKEIQPTTLKDVLAIIKSKPDCKVLIDGEGGIGKTTLLKYIAYNAATDKLFEGKFLFLLNVRDLQKRDGVLDLIAKQINIKDFSLKTELKEDLTLIKQFIAKHDDKFVLLLDGLDELRFENKCVIQLFRKEKLMNSVVILTSRTENINEFINACDLHVRVKGFGKKSIEKYIEKHFEYFGNPELGKSLRNELEIGQYSWPPKHPEICSMSKNPMLLLTICVIWEDSQNISNYKSDLFKEIFRSILNQFIEKQQHKFISNFEEAPEEYVLAMILLDVPISKSSFEDIYTPPHKLINESLVGFYLYKVVESKGIKNKCTDDLKLLLAPLDENEWKVIRESDHFKMTREFAIGFLGADAGSFLKHWISNDLSTYRSLVTCFKCVKHHHVDAVEKTLNNHISTTTLEIKQQIQDISDSLGMFMQHFLPHEETSEHVIHRIRQFHSFIVNIHCSGDDGLRWNEFLNTLSSDHKGKVLAHILCIATLFELNVANCNLTGDIINAMITECSNKGGKLKVYDFNINSNNLSGIDGTLLFSLLTISPQLDSLDMHNCNLSGHSINDMSRECAKRGGELSLIYLNVSSNNLSDIDGTLLGSLLSMFSKQRPLKMPRIDTLDMHDCNLSGEIMNGVIRECSNREVMLRLYDLNISGNNLGGIDGTLLCSLLIMSPRLCKLQTHNCNLSTDIMNGMITDFSKRGVNTKSLKYLNISRNDLRNINNTSLKSLLSVCPELLDLNMQECNLSIDVKNDVIRECSYSNVHLAL
ncbi:NACHT, LRR and PYD domains-containing protein 3-like [Antedon mediterranea]|uniref:NACHT, LRR and PYD domains-containing protein 3-like n=1 Tax=Antedon mediterranea TaxID=105859 RepID=UPI003AF82570